MNPVTSAVPAAVTMMATIISVIEKSVEVESWFVGSVQLLGVAESNSFALWPVLFLVISPFKEGLGSKDTATGIESLASLPLPSLVKENNGRRTQQSRQGSDGIILAAMEAMKHAVSLSSRLVIKHPCVGGQMQM